MIGSWDAYAERWSGLHGGYDPRRAPFPVRSWLFLVYGLSRRLSTWRIGPDAVTGAGLVLSALVPLAVRPGGPWLAAAALLVVLSSVADTADGALALITGRASRRGWVLDSTCDRLSEAAWVVALALAGAPIWFAVATGALAWLHEYVRARAVAAGMAEVGAVTVAERPTRILVLVFTLLAASAFGAPAATVGVGIWAVLGVIGFVQLSLAVRAALSGAPDPLGDELRRQQDQG
jgi:phosphatidylglycerophosphate synthase